MPDHHSVVVGIDPGLDGGVAALFLDGRALWAVPMPVLAGKRRELDAARLFDRLRPICPDLRGVRLVRLAVVERVASRPGQGVAGVFSFGRTVGRIEGVLAALGIPVEQPTPQRWKAEVLAGTAKDKAAAIAYAARRFPGINLVPEGKRVAHDGIAEALALAEFGRRLLSGESEGAA